MIIQGQKGLTEGCQNDCSRSDKIDGGIPEFVKVKEDV